KWVKCADCAIHRRLTRQQPRTKLALLYSNLLCGPIVRGYVWDWARAVSAKDSYGAARPILFLGHPILEVPTVPGCNPAPQEPPTPYLLPKIPGTFNALLSEYNNVYTGLTQTPPSISGQPPDLSQWANYNQGRCDGLTSPSTADPLTSTP